MFMRAHTLERSRTCVKSQAAQSPLPLTATLLTTCVYTQVVLVFLILNLLESTQFVVFVSFLASQKNVTFMNNEQLATVFR